MILDETKNTLLYKCPKNLEQQTGLEQTGLEQ